jgi:proteasome lid subunit RPN8/RPN11
VSLTPDEVEAIKRQAVEEYPNECCGAVLIRDDDRRLLRFRNVQDELHAIDPERHPRTAQRAYNVGHADQIRMYDLLAEGFHLAVIYHSHPDAAAYFSETDTLQAAPPPTHDALFPETTYVVVSLTEGTVDGLAAFRWDPVTRTFPPVDFAVMEASR